MLISITIVLARHGAIQRTHFNISLGYVDFYESCLYMAELNSDFLVYFFICFHVAIRRTGAHDKFGRGSNRGVIYFAKVMQAVDVMVPISAQSVEFERGPSKFSH